MKFKIIGIMIIIILLVVTLGYSGLLTSLPNINFVTQNKTHGTAIGYDELIGPNSRKGFTGEWEKNDPAKILREDFKCLRLDLLT